MKRFLRHLALSFIRQGRRRLFQPDPADVVDLAAVGGRDVAEPPARVAEKEKAHDLEDTLAPPHVDVPDVAELLEEAALEACLLGDLAKGGVGRALSPTDDSFRERPDVLARRANRGEMPPAAEPPHQHAPG